jgi:hypothetical protein
MGTAKRTELKAHGNVTSLKKRLEGFRQEMEMRELG